MADVFVYRITSTFREPGKKGFFLEDFVNGTYHVIFSFETLVKEVRENRDKLRYDGAKREHQVYTDGYFGRPLFPSDSYLMRRLYKREISALEKALNEADSIPHTRQ